LWTDISTFEKISREECIEKTKIFLRASESSYYQEDTGGPHITFFGIHCFTSNFYNPEFTDKDDDDDNLVFS
jgi:hypothetical protein